MGNQRKKSAVTIQKNVREMREKLERMEEELEAAREARYDTVGMYFYRYFSDCPEFDIIGMSDSKICRFMERLRWYYNSESYKWQSAIEEAEEEVSGHAGTSIFGDDNCEDNWNKWDEWEKIAAEEEEISDK